MIYDFSRSRKEYAEAVFAYNTEIRLSERLTAVYIFGLKVKKLTRFVPNE